MKERRLSLHQRQKCPRRGVRINVLENRAKLVEEIFFFAYLKKLLKPCISDFLSELGIEREDAGEDSPWDSEV